MAAIDTMEKLKLGEIGQDLLSLRSKFDNWVAKYGRKFRSKKERDKMFQLYCRVQKMVDEDMRAPSGSGLMRKPLVDCTRKNEDHSEKLKEATCQGLLSCSENDVTTRIEFDKLSHRKKFSSEKAREEAFRLFCRVKMLVAKHNSQNGGSRLALNMSEDTKAPHASGFCPVHPRVSLMSKPFVDCTGNNEEHSEELKEEIGRDLLSSSKNDQLLRSKFDEWAEKHGRKYSSESSQEEAFRTFCCLKKLFDKYNLRYQSPMLDHMFADKRTPCSCGLCSVPPLDSLVSKPHMNCPGNNKEHTEELEEAKQGRDLLPCSENDQSLRTMFDEWAIKYDRKYSSEKEREKSFQCFCRSKKLVDYKNSQNSSCTYALNKFADRGAPLMPYRPPVCAMYASDKEDSEELKEARVDFDKWAAKHGKVYCSEEESGKRFFIFMVNRDLLKPFKEDNPDCWIQLGCDKWLDLMDSEPPWVKGQLL